MRPALGHPVRLDQIIDSRFEVIENLVMDHLVVHFDDKAQVLHVVRVAGADLALDIENGGEFHRLAGEYRNRRHFYPGLPKGIL